MEYATSFYEGDECRAATPTEEAVKTLATAFSEIRSLYDAGTPLFTKELIRDVAQQLDEMSEKKRKVSVMGLNGVAVEFDIEEGRTLPAHIPNSEYIVRAPIIMYRSIQQLTSSLYNDVPRLAYCNLRIAYLLDLRDKTTHEILSTIPTNSFEEVAHFFETIRKEWKGSESSEQLRASFNSSQPPLEVTKIIGFALGSMFHRHRSDSARRAAFQHALILTLCDILGQKGRADGGVRCYLQDPAYTRSDKSVLENSGVRVLDNPKAFLEVDDTAVVVSCCPDAPIKQIISDLARPAVLVWDRIYEDDPKLIELDGDSPRLRTMIHDCYNELEFQAAKEHFGNLSIYIRKGKTSLPVLADNSTSSEGGYLPKPSG